MDFENNDDREDDLDMVESSRETIVDVIKNYIKIENELKHLGKLAREKRKMKKGLTGKIVELMKDNELDTIDTKSGKLTYSQRKTKQTLNKDTLSLLLNKYSGLSTSECKKLSSDILENREIKYTDIIKFKEN